MKLSGRLIVRSIRMSCIWFAVTMILAPVFELARETDVPVSEVLAASIVTAFQWGYHYAEMVAQEKLTV